MKSKKSKKTQYIILIVAILLVITGIIIALNHNNNQTEKPSSYPSQNTPSSPQKEIVYGVATEEDYNNFEEIITKNQMIQDLPDDSKIVLSFYKFVEGERIWEKSYLLSKNSVKEENIEDFDIKLIMSSKYITVLNENNFCQIIKLAQQNNDFGTTTEISKISLFWKYKGVLEHKDCFGL
jgi:hypothetical protein